MRKETEVAIKAVKLSGEHLLECFHAHNHEVQKKEDGSIVTDCDMFCHKKILETIQAAFNNHTIISEESPNSDKAVIGSEPTWVIDPLDGTSNFVAGIPLFGITIAFVEKGETVMGVFFDPLHDELFVAEKGVGSFLNDEPISVSVKDTTKKAMLFAGRGYKQKDKDRHGQIILAFEKETTYFRRLGSAAIMLAYVAAGRADSAILTGDKPWDTLAGVLLVKEAGGKVTDYCGNHWTYQSKDLITSNNLLHNKLVSITKIQNEC